MSALSKKIQAYGQLAGSFVLHILKTPFVARPGLQEFNRRFNLENIYAVHPDKRHFLDALNRCTACGQCDRCTPTDLPPPSLLIPRLARTLQDARSAQTILQQLQPFAPAIEQVCPERVQLIQLCQSVMSGNDQDNLK